MDNHETDASRRKFLTVATAGVGGAGLVAVSMPFVASMAPSEKTDRKSTRLNSSHIQKSRMPSSA